MPLLMSMKKAQIGEFVQALRGYVLRAAADAKEPGEPLLDLSVESLAFVDHYLEQTRKGGPISDQVLALLAPALGAYLGEVAIARFGGRWVAESDDPASWLVELKPAQLAFHPVGMAGEALRHDEVDGYDASLAARPDLMEPLADALARVPPVEEDYYYSLTGRLETVAHALDVLVELERISAGR